MTFFVQAKNLQNFSELAFNAEVFLEEFLNSGAKNIPGKSVCILNVSWYGN